MVNVLNGVGLCGGLDAEENPLMKSPRGARVLLVRLLDLGQIVEGRVKWLVQRLRSGS